MHEKDIFIDKNFSLPKYQIIDISTFSLNLGGT